MTDRRKFIQLTSAALAASSIPRLAEGATYQGLPDVPAADRALNILILGGTGFTGPFQVRYAVARGHSVTVFNRGRRQAELPASVKHLTGDRNTGDVAALKGTKWDVVIDNPTSLPFWIRDAAQHLKGNTNQYVMISTISVYDPKVAKGYVDEDSALLEYMAGDPLAVTQQDFMKDVGNLYGPMKTASERETLKQYGADRTTIIRPGLIVGPGDSSFRFTYWPWRIEQGGDIVVPAERDDPVQIIDARDLAEWTVRMVENRTVGTFNATGPRGLLTIGGMVHGVRAAFPGNKDVNFVWVPWSFLKQHEVQPWGELTTWIPKEDPESVISSTKIDRAIAAGLTFRPLADTSVAALEWVNGLAPDLKARVTKGAGLPAEKEKKVLEAWKAAPKS